MCMCVCVRVNVYIPQPLPTSASDNLSEDEWTLKHKPLCNAAVLPHNVAHEVQPNRDLRIGDILNFCTTCEGGHV